MKNKLSHYTPPGYSLTAESNIYILGMLFSTLFSFTFLYKLFDKIAELYEPYPNQNQLIPGAVMPDFIEILDDSLIGFILLAFCILIFIVVRYAYYYQGSKSIYLMHRLPNRYERHHRCITLPVSAAVSCLIAAFILLLIYYLIYIAATPKVCLTPDQWQKIWRELL